MNNKSMLKKSEFDEELKNLSLIPQIPYMEIESQIKKIDVTQTDGHLGIHSCVWQGKNIAIKRVILDGYIEIGKDLFHQIQALIET